MFDHVHLRVANFVASCRFYRAVHDALELHASVEEDDHHLAIGALYIDAADTYVTRVHLAFRAGSRDRVDAFFAAAIAAGGTANGAPGLRDYGPGYYAAFVLDPDGNNVEAVFHDR